MKKDMFGEYYFELKKCPEIKFKANKNFGNHQDDLCDRLTQYLFNNWNHPKKNKFKVIQYYRGEKDLNQNGLLVFNAYIEINNYDELMEGIQMIVDFFNYGEQWNKDNGKVADFWQQKEGEFVLPLWDVYLMKDGKIIQPYSGTFQTEDEIIEKAKKLYNELL